MFAFVVPVGLVLSALLSFSATSVNAVPLEKRVAGNTKFVVAHHIVGNTYPYKVSDWLADINLAHATGIDGFALNIGSDSWQSARVADAYTAAKQSGTGFKLFLSFDMSSLPSASASDAAALRQYITTYATHPNQFKYQGGSFASTFSGETSTFGTASAAIGWKTLFKDPLSATTPVYFVPSFFVDPAKFSTYAIDGAFNWNSAWPISLTSSAYGSAPLSSAAEALLSSTATDKQYENGLSSGQAYMASVSPWFFTHYGPDTYNKNWIYITDESLYATRWENLVENRESIDIVEVITWNDYGESHYLGPIKGAQPNSQEWVDGFDHQGWLALTSYYAAAFKTGKYPMITKDKVVMWARPHSKLAVALNDTVSKPTNWELSTDNLWAVILLTSPATVTLSTSLLNTKSFTLPAGASKVSIPLVAGSGQMHATVVRNGNKTVDFTSVGYKYDAAVTDTYNWNAFVAASP